MSFHSHIGVLAFPFGTHAAPLLALVRRLAVSAPEIKFSFFTTTNSKKTVFSSECNNISSYDVWDGIPESDAFMGNHFDEIRLFLDATPSNFEEAIEKAEAETGLAISCLLTDAFLWFASGLAEQRGVPWLAFWTAASCSLSTHMYTDQIRNNVGEMDFAEVAEEKLTFLPGMPFVRYTDLPGEIFLRKGPTIPLAITIYKMVQNLPKSSAVILNSFEEIDAIITNDMKQKFQHFLNIGPSTLTISSPARDDHGCIPWLDNQKPKSVVYIGFGTTNVPLGNELVELVHALEDTKIPFIWSLRDDMWKLLPDGFVTRARQYGKIVSWAPQLQVLSHDSIGVFVSHCGWNSVLESISCGVPLIGRPFFGDQKLNCKMVEDAWKIGMKIKGGVFTKTGTIEALHRMMSDEAGNVMRQNVNNLRLKAMNAVTSEGSSTKNFKKLLEIIKSPKRYEDL